MGILHTLKFIVNHPVNKDNKFNSIIRFAKWQIGSRLLPGAIVYDWINGSKFLVRSGETGFTGNIYTGLHEFQDMAFLLHVLKKDDMFIDVGANVGSYTVLACAAVGASGYAFEPVPDTFDKLMENIRINHMENRVNCINIALGDKTGSIAFTRGMDTMNHVVFSDKEGENMINVDIFKMDEVLTGVSPSLIKIDVEGYELPVLEGAIETLKKQTLNSVIMELNGSGVRYGYDETNILKMMFDLGFKTYSYNPFDRKLFDLQGKNLNSGNTLFIRNKSFVKEKLQSAPKITVFDKRF